MAQNTYTQSNNNVFVYRIVYLEIDETHLHLKEAKQLIIYWNIYTYICVHINPF